MSLFPLCFFLFFLKKTSYSWEMYDIQEETWLICSSPTLLYQWSIMGNIPCIHQSYLHCSGSTKGQIPSPIWFPRERGAGSLPLPHTPPKPLGHRWAFCVLVTSAGDSPLGTGASWHRSEQPIGWKESGQGIRQTVMAPCQPASSLLKLKLGVAQNLALFTSTVWIISWSF